MKIAAVVLVMLAGGCAKPHVVPEVHRDCVSVVVGTVGPLGIYERPAWLCARDTTARAGSE